MFERIREWLDERQEKKLRGLSKALRIVDKHMKADMTAKQISINAGYAHTEIHQMYLDGDISWTERNMAVETLLNHYEKMWNMATFREKNT